MSRICPNYDCGNRVLWSHDGANYCGDCGTELLTVLPCTVGVELDSCKKHCMGCGKERPDAKLDGAVKGMASNPPKMRD